MWTAMCTILKNTQKVDMFEQTKFLGFSHNSQFSKTDHRFWKSYKAFSWDQAVRLFGHLPLGHTLQSKFFPFCNQKCPPFLHTIWVQNVEISITPYPREKILFQKMLSKAFIDDSQKHRKLGIFGLVVLSTQLHEEIRALTFDPLWRLHFRSDCSEL